MTHLVTKRTSPMISIIRKTDAFIGFSSIRGNDMSAGPPPYVFHEV